LLKVKSHQGAGTLDGASFIRPVDTSSGAGPAGGCDGAHVGNAARVPFTALYQFLGPESIMRPATVRRVRSPGAAFFPCGLAATSGTCGAEGIGVL